MPSALLLSCLTGLALHAEEAILVQARIIEAAANVKLTKADSESTVGWEKRGVHLLSQPRLLTHSGSPARLFVGESRPVSRVGDSSLTNVQVGVELRILAVLEEERIKYTTSVMVRKQEPLDAKSGGPQAEFSVREYDSSGSCKNGESVFLSARGLHNDRRLYLHLTLTKQGEK